jgi:nucleoside-diphosphate-sugar epimerase
MRTIIVTGSAGLIGSKTVRRFAKGTHVVGIDYDMRATILWRRGDREEDT